MSSVSIESMVDDDQYTRKVRSRELPGKIDSWGRL